MAGLASLLEALASRATGLPLWLLVTAHTLTVCELYSGYTPYWAVSWLVCYLGAFGGGHTSAWLLQVSRIAARCL